MPGVTAPKAPEPAPANLASDCYKPRPIALTASAQDLADWTLEWMGAWRCEHDKRAALVKAWPK